VVRRVGARPVTVAAAVVLAAARLALTAAPGGRTQLWLATAGLLAGLVWLVGVAADTDRPVPGLALGFAVNAALHAVLDTVDLVWRGGWLAWLLSSVAVVLFVLGTAQPGTRADGVTGTGGVRAWLLAGPALLLAAMVALSPALARTGMSYLVAGDGVARSPLFGLAPVPVAVAGFLCTALTRPPRGWSRAYGPVALLAGAVLFALDRGDLLLPAILLAAVGLGACLALTDDASGPDSDASDASNASARAARRGYAVAAGMLVFALGAVGYYSAYDLGYPNAAVPVLVAGLVAVVAFAARPVVHRLPGPFPPLRAAAAVTALALLAPVLADDVPVASNRAAGAADRGGLQHPDGFRAGRSVRPARPHRGRRTATTRRGAAQRGGPRLAAQRWARHPGPAGRPARYAVRLRAGRRPGLG
jgi:hypothetical protein